MAARKWTPEQKQQQAKLIQRWSPWLQSTGPLSAAGKRAASGNAYKGGLRSELRKLEKEINELLRFQQELLSRF